MTIIDQNVKSLVIKEYLNGTSRDKIAQIAGISAGTTSSIIKDWKYGINMPNVEQVRDFSIEVKKAGMSIGQCAQGYRMFQVMKNLGITDDDDENDENDLDNPDVFGNSNKSNNKIKYNEFSSFVQSVYRYCKKHGIEPNMIFAWIADLNYFKPMVSTLSCSVKPIENSSNNNNNNDIESSLLFSNKNQENQSFSKEVPLISQISSFINQKKKVCIQLKDYEKNLKNEIKKIEIERNDLKIENEILVQSNSEIIPYLDWYYKLKKELDDGYSIGIEDFEKFAKLINDFRNLDLDIPKIIEKYITAVSIEDKIKEESQKLDRLKMQTIQANKSPLNGQDEINQHTQYFNIYRQLESMGFGLKEIKQLQYVILEIALANNITEDNAILKFLKDVEEQYDNILGFDLKVNEKRNELNKLNSQIVSYQHILKATPFVGSAITNLFQKGVFEQDILDISEIIETYTNNNDTSIQHSNKNNNNNIKNNVSKAEQMSQLINDIQNYKNVDIDIKEKQSELDILQNQINDLDNQKQQIEKYLQNFKSFMNSINNKIFQHKEFTNYFNRFNTINLSSKSYPLIDVYKKAEGYEDLGC